MYIKTPFNTVQNLKKYIIFGTKTKFYGFLTKLYFLAENNLGFFIKDPNKWPDLFVHNKKSVRLKRVTLCLATQPLRTPIWIKLPVVGFSACCKV